MDDTKHVLLVTNSATNEEINLIKETLMGSADNGLRIRLSLVHVIPNLPTCYFNIPSMAQLAKQYYEDAKQCLVTAGDSLGIAKKDQWLITGRLKTEVFRLANKIGSHFILASSSSIQDLHKALSNKKGQPAQIRNINTLAVSNF